MGSTRGQLKVLEGRRINITCTATGVPTPTVFWTFNTTTTPPFNQIDAFTDFRAISVSSDQVDLILGRVVSTLLVVNPRYPAHQGVYTCLGRNSYAGTGNININLAVITLQVQGEQAANFIQRVHAVSSRAYRLKKACNWKTSKFTHA